MNVQNHPQFVLATPNREFSAGVLRRYLYSAKSYAEIVPAKKYLLSYYAHEKYCVFKWDFKSQTFESYPKKVITDFHIQKDVVEFVNTKGQVTGVFIFNHGSLEIQHSILLKLIQPNHVFIENQMVGIVSIYFLVSFIQTHLHSMNLTKKFVIR